MTKKTIGKLIENKRLLTGVSKTKLCDNIGIQRNQYDAVINARSNYTIETLYKILKYLGLAIFIKDAK